MNTKFLADSTEGVVQLIAASYLRHGYYWYVTGQIPRGKDPTKTDEKLMSKYGTDVTEWERARRKKSGIANAKYIRLDDWFIILVTDGHHPIKQPESKGGEGSQLKDCRRHPIRIQGYSISYRRGGVTPKGGADPKWHAHVRIDRPTYKQLKSHFESIAMHRNGGALALELSRITFARYAPVRRQLLNILRSVNEKRKSQAFDLIPHQALKLRRVPVKVYAEDANQDGEGREAA